LVTLAAFGGKLCSIAELGIKICGHTILSMMLGLATDQKCDRVGAHKRAGSNTDFAIRS